MGVDMASRQELIAANQSVEGTATDLDGNTSTTTVSINIDKTLTLDNMSGLHFVIGLGVVSTASHTINLINTQPDFDTLIVARPIAFLVALC